MAAYIARLIADRQIVGVYCVNDESDLFWLVDECCSPDDVEIAKVGPGGIFWGSFIDHKVPIPVDENGDPAYDALPDGASLTESWAASFYFGSDSLVWMPVPSFK